MVVERHIVLMNCETAKGEDEYPSLDGLASVYSKGVSRDETRIHYETTHSPPRNTFTHYKFPCSAPSNLTTLCRSRYLPTMRL